MNLFSATERLAAIDRSAVTFHPERCLHTLDRFSDCQACFDLCPVEVIQVDKPPRFNSEGCAHCLACLPACPTGAFSADGELNALLNCVARLADKSLEILCGRNARLEEATCGSNASVQIRECLAGLGASAYICLAALGFEQVTIRLDGCQGCPWGSLEMQIERQLQQARRLLAGAGASTRLALVRKPELEPRADQPVLDAHNPFLSRRDLFRIAATGGKTALARALAKEGEGATARQPAYERRRMINVLLRLPAESSRPAGSPASSAEVSLEGLGFASLQVGESCTACKACTRICPTGALSCEWDEGKSSFRLRFLASHCSGCQACLHACLPQAIQINPAPTYKEVFGRQEPVDLYKVETRRCQRCKTPFPAKDGEKLCPACEFRRSHPFGAVPPPHLTGMNGQR